MKIPLRDLIELCALGLVVAAVFLAAGLWPSLLAGGAALGYLSHAWEIEDISLPWPKKKATE